MQAQPLPRHSTSSQDRYLAMRNGSKIQKSDNDNGPFPLRAPADCTQYFTGTSGTVQSYNFQGGQLLVSQYYTNCIRTERGYCGILWKESSSTSPDPFQMTASPVTNAEATACPNSYIYIPNLR